MTDTSEVEVILEPEAEPGDIWEGTDVKAAAAVLHAYDGAASTGVLPEFCRQLLVEALGERDAQRADLLVKWELYQSVNGYDFLGDIDRRLRGLYANMNGAARHRKQVKAGEGDPPLLTFDEVMLGYDLSKSPRPRTSRLHDGKRYIRGWQLSGLNAAGEDVYSQLDLPMAPVRLWVLGALLDFSVRADVEGMPISGDEQWNNLVSATAVCAAHAIASARWAVNEHQRCERLMALCREAAAEIDGASGMQTELGDRLRAEA